MYLLKNCTHKIDMCSMYEVFSPISTSMMNVEFFLYSIFSYISYEKMEYQKSQHLLYTFVSKAVLIFCMTSVFKFNRSNYIGEKMTFTN